MLFGLKFECCPAQRHSFKKEDSVAQTKVVAFAFMRRHFITACSVKCTEVFAHFYFPGHLFLREIKGAGDL